jgi:hypothetical protein
MRRAPLKARRPRETSLTPCRLVFGCKIVSVANMRIAMPGLGEGSPLRERRELLNQKLPVARVIGRSKQSLGASV